MMALNRTVWTVLCPLALVLTACDLGDRKVGDEKSGGTTEGSSETDGGGNGATEGNSGGNNGYDPCAGLSCGEECTLCPPNDPDCVETLQIKTCSADGACGVWGVDECSSAPQCGGIAGLPCPDGLTCVDDPTDDCDPEQGGADCGGICQDLRNNLCERLSCGDPCWPCSPGDSECNDPGVGGFACDAQGACAPAEQVTCDDAVYDPCDGLSCGDQCFLCAPDDPDCAETAVIKTCNVDGVCEVGASQCDEPPRFCGGFGALGCPGDQICIDDASDDCDPFNGGADCGGLCIDYDPCGGLECGVSCQLCPLEAIGCVEDQVLKACSVDGQCVADDGFLCE